MSRREKLEAMLAQNPDDSFLEYALAMQCAAEGDVPVAVRRMAALLERDPQYVPAYFQLAQIVAGQGAADRARPLLVRGIEVARGAAHDHAEGEMRGFLEQLG